MSGNDPGLFVVPGGIAGQLEDLCGQVLHDGGQVDRGSGSHTLGVVSLAEQSYGGGKSRKEENSEDNYITCEYVPLGTEDLLGWTWTWPSPWTCLLCLFRTFSSVDIRLKLKFK